MLVFAFAALLITVGWGYAYVPLAGAVLCCVALWRWRGIRLDREDVYWCLAFGGYGAYWALDIWLTSGAIENTGGLALPLWPLMAAVLLIWLRGYAPRAHWLWGGIMGGALGAAAVAIYERAILHVPRASNDMNAIIFGNLSMLLGVMSLSLAMAMLFKRSQRSGAWGAVAWVAGLAGVLASLLSGTRGGWVGLPVVLWVVYRTYAKEISRRLSLLLAAGIVILTTLVLIIPQLGVSSRIQQGMNDLEQYFGYGNAGTSVGVRLDMWRGGGWLFLDKPWTGWGEGGLEAERDRYVAQGRLHHGVSVYDQLHNDIIDTAARRGLLGLAFLGLLYGVPLWLFWRRLSHPDLELRALALAGVLIPLTFLDFGLTQSMLRDARGLAAYLGLSVIAWSVLKRKEQEYGALQ